MDNIVIWVGIIGVGGTLFGVWLGNWLQSRNIKQQRDWILQDQKREWLRNRRREEFQRILEYLESSIEYTLKSEWVIKVGSKEEQAELYHIYAHRAASAMPIIYTMMGEDKELADLLFEFGQCGKEATQALQIGDYSKLSDAGRRASEFAGLIRQRLNKSLEQTFD